MLALRCIRLQLLLRQAVTCWSRFVCCPALLSRLKLGTLWLAAEGVLRTRWSCRCHNCYCCCWIQVDWGLLLGDPGRWHHTWELEWGKQPDSPTRVFESQDPAAGWHGMASGLAL